MPPLAAPRRRPRVVNVHEAKTQLSRLLLLVEEGEEVWIARAGQPVARLTAWLGEVTAVHPPGAMRQAIRIANNFDAPLALPGNAAGPHLANPQQR